MKNSDNDKTVQALSSWIKSFTDWRSTVTSDIEKFNKAHSETDVDFDKVNIHIEELYRLQRLSDSSISKLYKRNKIVLIISGSVLFLTIIDTILHLSAWFYGTFK